MRGASNQTAGRHLFRGSSKYRRIARFRPNGVSMDFPGRYVCLRGDADGGYRRIGEQPAGKPLDQVKYACRHGLSCSKYLCDCRNIRAERTPFAARDDPVGFWRVTIRNEGGNAAHLSVVSRCESSFRRIGADNRNFRRSLRAGVRAMQAA